MEKVLPISLKLNFAPNTFGCYGLSYSIIDSALKPEGLNELSLKGIFTYLDSHRRYLRYMPISSVLEQFKDYI